VPNNGSKHDMVWAELDGRARIPSKGFSPELPDHTSVVGQKHTSQTRRKVNSIVLRLKGTSEARSGAGNVRGRR